MKFIRYEQIPTKALISNPRNPRSDLGDLTELIESISQNGIYQELTVVPHGRNRVNEGYIDAYMVIIGHRRLAAAKAAGLSTVPCKVVEMSAEEQQTTMLTENVQRSDLTPLEEANGIQMCLDLGIPEEVISKKAGMSARVIKTRKLLLQYDGELVKDTFAKGMTLQDYIDAQKIEDSAEREKLITKYGGTGDFRFQLTNAIDNQTRKKASTVIINKIKAFASPIPDGENVWHYDFVTQLPTSMDLSKLDERIESMLKEHGKNTQYYYEPGQWGITLRKVPSRNDSDRLKREKESSELRDRCIALDKDIALARKNRATYVKGLKEYLPKNQHLAKRNTFLYVVGLLTKYWYGQNTPSIVTDIIFHENWKPDEDGLEEFGKIYDSRPVYACILLEYILREKQYGNSSLYSWKGEFNRDAGDNLKQLYVWLAKLDYHISETERQLINGRHPQYKKSEADGHA